MLQGNEHSRSWVSGSPRPNGNTDTIVRAALDHIQQLEGGTTEFFGLGGKSVPKEKYVEIIEDLLECTGKGEGGKVKYIVD